MTIRKGVVPSVLAGGLLGAAGDLGVACTLSGLPLLTVGKAVARGWFGRARAMAGGTDVALIGLGSHVAIVLVFAAVFVAASLRQPVLRRLWFVAGPLDLLRDAVRGAAPVGGGLFDAEAAGALLGNRRPSVSGRVADRARRALVHRQVIRHAVISPFGCARA